MRTCSPVPQPTSTTRPQSTPAGASFTNAGWGRPMSHGGVAVYMASKSSGRLGRSGPGNPSGRCVSVMGDVCTTHGA